MCMACGLKARKHWPTTWLKLWVQDLHSPPLSSLHDVSILCMTYGPEPCIRTE